jgi:uncharacterized membrane protein YphA (DoxX/SURF4 family)/thiol-disulfide isomerase/thioredoxin
VEIVALVARIVLALVLIVAAAAKASRVRDAALAAEGFGAPRRIAPAVVVATAGIEVLLAGWLVSGLATRPAALATLALLLLFTAVVARALRAGKRPACNCFGALSQGPVGGHTLLRNAVLAVLAVAVVVADGPVTWRPSLLAVVAGTALVVALTSAAACLLVLRQNGRLLRRIDQLEAGAGEIRPTVVAGGLSVGATAPRFDAVDLDGRAASLERLLEAGRPLLLVFGDARCAPCDALLPDIAAWQRDLAGQLTVAMLIAGERDLVRAKVSEHGLEHVVLQSDDAIAASYRYAGTPGAVLIAADGTISRRLVSGAPAIRALIAAVATIDEEPKQAPQLPGVAAQVGTRLVLFFDPACPYCAAILPELQRWRPRPGGRDLVVVSRRPVEGLAATTVVDADGAIMQSFGVSGTPIAVEVSPDGTASRLHAVGGPAVVASLDAVSVDEEAMAR